jgi:hypothetical protein
MGLADPELDRLKFAAQKLVDEINRGGCGLPHGMPELKDEASFKQYFKQEALEWLDLGSTPHVKPSSNPGYPLNNLFSTNKELVDMLGPVGLEELAERIAARAWKWTTADAPAVFSDEYKLELLNDDVIDPIWQFIKVTATPARKQATGDSRIINAVSLMIQIIERILFTYLYALIKGRYPHHPVLCMIGHNDENTQLMAPHVAQLLVGHFGFQSDVKGWDNSWRSWLWRFQKIILSCDEEITLNRPLFEDQPPVWWVKMVRFWCAQCDNHVLAVPKPLENLDATQARELWKNNTKISSSETEVLILSRDHTGGQISGSYMTTLSNCCGRYGVAIMAGASTARAVGDDCIEVYPLGTTVEEVKEKYSELGYVLRDTYEALPNKFSLTSHDYDKVDGTWKARLQPEACDKAAFEIFHKEFSLENMTNYSNVTRNVVDAPSRTTIDALLQRMHDKFKCLSPEEIAILERHDSFHSTGEKLCSQ